MDLEKIKVLRLSCLQHTDNWNDPSFQLLMEVADYILKKEIKYQIEDGWLTADEFVRKYPICHSSELHKMHRYSESFKECFKKNGRHFYFDPLKVFNYISNNKNKLTKTYKRLKEHNFFGYSMNE